MRPVQRPLGTRPGSREGVMRPALHPRSSVDTRGGLARHPAIPRSPGTNLVSGEAACAA
ncbi:hypothetical protein [Lentzea pudingi]|uniref:hypothetical protein n=1 Tax=Lentzea pudingi TaxID=1789439 RepID=UPI0016656CF5|nr:hypothetical protein [Lentzea pudingi]